MALEAPRRRRRSDALANRARILKAARGEFARHGIAVPITAIANRAGVGTATLYRHFPTRRVLIAAAFTDQLHACTRVIADAAQDPDPWRAFETAVRGVCSMQRADRGFTHAFLAAYPHQVDVEGEQVTALNTFSTLAHHAKEAGRLHPDFGLADLISLLIAHDALLGSFPGDPTAASRRFLAASLGAWDARGLGDLPPRPPVAHLRWMP